ncbi:LegC family aminotransferase [uncultured Desulfobulbus sp.]|uniref:LegC family aminotransferase n=1 Tax=uncultured Desulfobulbus sp. TaxID=239745 RepID=UPI0029C814D3|nr:LegC family aminotransferase [uncultured Desulfobulbus sp.]
MVESNYDSVIAFIRSLYPRNAETIPLHAPIFLGNEKRYVADCLDSSFVSSIGPYVTQLETMMCERTGAAYAVATNSGTAALHAALLSAGVESGDEVLTQPISFVATANAIAYCNAVPVFIDVELTTMGLCPEHLERFLHSRTYIKSGVCYNRKSGRKIAACVPMHTFGHPVSIQQIIVICESYHIPVIEDAAEALGSYSHNKHCGTFGLAGIFSFNGNKIVTSGGGGMIVTDNSGFAEHARHLTTTAKKPHPYAYEHTQVGYNYRMPNINAALCCGQLEQLDIFLAKKRWIAEAYKAFFEESSLAFVKEPDNARSNYWLNSIMTQGQRERDCLLEQSCAAKIMTRPVWAPLNRLPMFKHCETYGTEHTDYLAQRIVNLPSSVAL